MKKLLLCLFIFLPLLASAQTMKETRVYYLDCTYTMIKPNAVWDEVRDNLKRAINNVQDETTELIVIPFWDKSKTLTPYKQFATDEGKKKLCKIIDNLDCPKKSYTLLGTPLMDFYENRVSHGQDNITYMFFMTDGENEDDNEREIYGKVMFYDKLKEWGQRYGDKQVYGFYVMLCGSAKSAKIEDIIEPQPHLWKVETADININIVRLETEPVFNVRNDKYAYCTIQGDVSKGNLKIEMEDNQHYQIRGTKIEKNMEGSDMLRLEIEPSFGQSQSTLPKDMKLKLSASLTGAGDYTFLVTDKITLRCLNEKEYVVNVPKEINGKSSFHQPFLWSDGKRVPLETSIDFEFSDDAKAEPSCFAEFSLVDKEGRTLPQNEVTVYVDGEKSANNSFRVSSKEDTKKIRFEFGPDFKKGKHQGYLRLTKHNLDRINNHFLSPSEISEDVVWTIHYHKKMNPLAFVLMWIGIVIAAFLLIWFALIRPNMYPHFKRMIKNVLIKQNGRIIKNMKVVFTGSRTVYFANKKVKQSLLNRVFVGKIVTVTDPIFVDQLKFIPRRKDAMATGLNYTVMPNPIPRNGVANIKNAKQNFEITLN